MGLHMQPCTRDQANEMVSLWHRHHKPVHPMHSRYQIAASGDDGLIVGVCIVGRPSARMACDGRTVEVLRVATDGTRNACSFLLGAARRAAFDLGYSRIITYTLPSEGGASLRGAGWQLSSSSAGGGSWSRTSRPREDSAPMDVKCRWEALRPSAPVPTWPELQLTEDMQVAMWNDGL